MILPATIYASTLAELPPVPSTVPIYKTTLTTTTNETTTTWTAVDIGTPHPKRIIVLACWMGVTVTAASSTVNGIPHYTYPRTTLNDFTIMAVRVPNDTTATITASHASSLTKAVAVYVYYPKDHTMLDSGSATGTTTTNATVADQKVQAGGCLIYVGGQNATLGAFTTTWTGPDAVTEDIDAQLEAGSYTMGNIVVSVSSDTHDLTLAETVSGTKRLAAMTFGPP